MSRPTNNRRISFLLAGAAVTALASIAAPIAKADLSLSLGVDGTYEQTRNGHQYVFIDPNMLPGQTNTWGDTGGTLLVDVFATITGTQTVTGGSPSYANGLKYAYYSIKATSNTAGANAGNFGGPYSPGNALPLLNQLNLVKNSQTAPLVAQSNTPAFTSNGAQGGAAASAGFSSGATILGGSGTNYTSYIKANASTSYSGSNVSQYAAFNVSGSSDPATTGGFDGTGNGTPYTVNTGTSTRFLIAQIPVNIPAITLNSAGSPNASDFSVTLAAAVPTAGTFNNSVPAAIWSEGTPIANINSAGLPDSGGITTQHTPSASNVTDGTGHIQYKAGTYSAAAAGGTGSITIETVNAAMNNGDLLPGDTNFDGTVDFNNDFANFQNGYQSAGDWVNGDIKGYGLTDFNNDFANFQNSYGSSISTPGPLPAALPSGLISAPSAVPEPASLSAVLIGATGLIMRRRRSR